MNKFLASWLLFFMFGTSVFCQSSRDIRITKKYNNKSLRDVLHDLNETYNLKFYYVDQQVDTVKITARIQNQELERSLKMILNKTKLGFFFDKERIVLYFDARKILSKQPPMRNVFTLQGTIADLKTGVGIPSVNVYILNSQTGVVSDTSGHYVLKDLIEGIYVIQYSFIGYSMEERKIDLRDNVDLNISLRESPTELEPIEISPNVYEISLTEQSPLILTDKEILHSPNLVKDIGRTLRVLPGLANTDFSAKPRIRGGNPDETAFYLDNFEIMEPFHLEEVNGLFTIFNTDYVSKLKVIPGGFSTSYTDKTSGIIDMKSPDRFDKNSATASVDLLNTSLLIKRKITDKLDVQFSGRRTYVDLLLRNAEGVYFSPIYFDIWSKVNYRANDKNSFSFNALHATDIANATVNLNFNQFHFDGTKYNDYVWSNWKYMPNERYQHITTAGFQRLARYADFNFNNSISQNNVDNRIADVIILRHTSYLTKGKNNIEFGGETKYFNAHFRFNEIRFNTFKSTRDNTVIDSIDVNSRRAAFNGALFFQNTINITDKFDVMAGGRLCYFSTATNPLAFAPRISAGYKLSERLSVKAAYGVYNQNAYLQDTRVFNGEPSPPKDYKQSLHYIGNITWSNDRTNIMLSGYYKDNRKLQDDYVYDVSNRAGGGISILDQSFQTVSGYSKGVEAVLRHKYGNKSSVSVSYAYAINKIRNSQGAEAYRDNDRRHTLIINNMLNLKYNWTISTYSLFYSGEPYTSSNTDFVGNNNGRLIVFYTLGEKNDKRLPSFYSLDIRIDKSWNFRKWTMNIYLNLMNVTNHENVRNYWWIPYENSSGEMMTEKVKETYFSKLIVSPGISLSF